MSLFIASRKLGRIPIVLVLGEPGSGKTAFLSLLLKHVDMKDSVVLGLDAATQDCLSAVRFISVPSGGAPTDDGCLCCGMQSGLGDTLRKLFFEALTDRSRRLDRVFIQTRDMEVGLLAKTLRHTPFLGQRYTHQMTFRLMTAPQLFADPEKALIGLDPVTQKDEQFLIVSESHAYSDEQFNALVQRITRDFPYQKVLRLDTKWLLNALGLS